MWRANRDLWAARNVFVVFDERGDSVEGPGRDGGVIDHGDDGVQRHPRRIGAGEGCVRSSVGETPPLARASDEPHGVEVPEGVIAKGCECISHSSTPSEPPLQLLSLVISRVSPVVSICETARVRFDIVVFDGVDEMDALGPLEVLRSAATMGADIDAWLVTAIVSCS